MSADPTEIVTALAKASRVPEDIAAAALAIEDCPEFRRMFLPLLDGGLHPAAIAFARAALRANAPVGGREELSEEK